MTVGAMTTVPTSDPGHVVAGLLRAIRGRESLASTLAPYVQPSSPKTPVPLTSRPRTVSVPKDQAQRLSSLVAVLPFPPQGALEALAAAPSVGEGWHCQHRRCDLSQPRPRRRFAAA